MPSQFWVLSPAPVLRFWQSCFALATVKLVRDAKPKTQNSKPKSGWSLKKSGFVRNGGSIMIETTLVLLKPDCLADRHCGNVINRFEAAGLEIVGCKMMLLADDELAEHYAHILDRPFYPELKSFMQSSPVIALALSGENAVTLVRELMGPTDSRKAVKGTIRGDFGRDVMFNVVHGSDSPENAAAELKRFFADNELFEVSLRR
jgi:nucleoside-diphosphate kinase